jgi:transposase
MGDLEIGIPVFQCLEDRHDAVFPVMRWPSPQIPFPSSHDFASEFAFADKSKSTPKNRRTRDANQSGPKTKLMCRGELVRTMFLVLPRFVCSIVPSCFNRRKEVLIKQGRESKRTRSVCVSVCVVKGGSRRHGEQAGRSRRKPPPPSCSHPEHVSFQPR